jgi:hypothetical protein
MRRQSDPDRILRSEAKRRLASKVEEIRRALWTAGYYTTAQQAVAMGVLRSTAWGIFNSNEMVGPSAKIIKRILSSPKLPPAARRKVEEYVEEKISGLYGDSERSKRRFRDQFTTVTATPRSAIAFGQHYDH